MRNAVIVVSLALSLAPTGDAAADAWEVRGAMPDDLRIQEVGAVNGRIFAIGNNHAGTLSLTYEFIPGATAIDDAWLPRAPKPGPLVSRPLAVALDGLLYVLGGALGGIASVDRVDIYDPGSDTWSEGPPLPLEVNNGAAATLDGRIYYTGGCCSNRDELFIFDPELGWTTSSARLPRARNGLGGCAAAGRFLAIGGYIFPGTELTDNVDMFDPETESWLSSPADLPPMPTPRNGHGVANCGDDVYVIGGTGPELLDTVEVLNLSTLTWATTPAVPQMPFAVAGKGVVRAGDRIWVLPFDSRDGTPVQVLHADSCRSGIQVSVDIKPLTCPNPFNPVQPDLPGAAARGRARHEPARRVGYRSDDGDAGRGASAQLALSRRDGAAARASRRVRLLGRRAGQLRRPHLPFSAPGARRRPRWP